MQLLLSIVDNTIEKNKNPHLTCANARNPSLTSCSFFFLHFTHFFHSDSTTNPPVHSTRTYYSRRRSDRGTLSSDQKKASSTHFRETALKMSDAVTLKRKTQQCLVELKKRRCTRHGIAHEDVGSVFETAFAAETDSYVEGSDVSDNKNSPHSTAVPSCQPDRSPKRVSSTKDLASPRRTHRMTTRSVKWTLTSNKVFSTGELLEKILIELPPHAIVKFRLVSKAWKHIITTLPAIRQKIFLEARPFDDIWILDNATEVLRPYTESQDGRGDFLPTSKLHCTPATLNPMLFQREPQAESISLMDRASHCEVIRFVARPNMLRRPFDGVYHDMFVTQPPIKIVEMRIKFHDRDQRRWGRCCPLQDSGSIRVERAEGVKLKDLLLEFKNAVEGDDGILRDVAIKVRDRGSKRDLQTEKASLLYMLGAIFVSEEEKGTVNAMKTAEEMWPGEATTPVVVALSPQAEELAKGNCGKTIDFRGVEERRGEEERRRLWLERRDMTVFGMWKA